MTRTHRRSVTMTAVLILTCAQCPPSARAVTPPPIDNSFLPSPAHPAPPRRTHQVRPCTTMTFEQPSNPTPSAQLSVDKRELWRLSRGRGQRIALIDTGIQPHSRISHVLGGGDYVSTGDGTQDCDGHGTLVAGLIAATPDPANETGFSGLAPDATLISIRQSSIMFSPDASNDGTANDESGTDRAGVGDIKTLAMAVRTAADLGASVINISTVSCTNDPPDDRILGAALAYAVDIKDAVVVSAAGNVSSTNPRSGSCSAQNSSSSPTVYATPSWYDDYVLTVGSVSAAGQPSEFSLRGPWVDVAAIGESITSLDIDGEGVVNRISQPGKAVPIAGTTYAAPIVTGLAALIRARFPRLSARQVMDRITRTAQKRSAGDDLAIGAGIVNITAALSDTQPADARIRSTNQSPAAPIRSLPDLTGSNSASSVNPSALLAAAACLIIMATIALWPRLSRRDHRSHRITNS